MSFQLQAQILDFCVLALIEKEDSYGYKLTQEMVETFDISESTLYPVLRRLKQNKDLRTYDKAFDGRNRRYYQITPQGKELLKTYRNYWKAYIEQVESIVGADHD